MMCVVILIKDCLTIIVILLMREEGIRLNQLVSGGQLKSRCLSQMHKLGNSLRRSSNRNDFGTLNQTLNQTHNYQSKMMEVGFGRKDLSLILKYLFYKQEMQLSDRNLLRRILISTFEEETICAGTKKFIHFLRLLEGKGRLQCQPPNKLYFLLKGKGVVSSSGYEYNVQAGKIFGEIEILSQNSINSIDFQSSYLLLILNESQFNVFYRSYFQRLYSDKLSQLDCIKDPYLTRIPLLARYLLLDKIEYKHYDQGERIIEAGQPLQFIYFIGDQKSKSNHKKHQLPCLGLIELLKGLKHYQQSFKCLVNRMKLPCVKSQDFRVYVLEPLRLESIDRTDLDLSRSFLSLNTPEMPKERPLLSSFMRRKKVRISLGKSRRKTDIGQYSEIKFKFLKPQNMNSSFRYKRHTEKRLGSSLQTECNVSFLSRKF